MRRGVVLALWCAACGKDAEPAGKDRQAPGGGDEAACGPLEVAIDGAPVTGLGAGFAARVIGAGGTSLEVAHSTAPDAGCEQMLRRGGLVIREGVTVVRASVGAWAGVGVGPSFTTHPTLVRLDGAEPAAAGDRVTLCVKPTSVGAGRTAITMRGALSGTYCGERRE